VVDASRQPELLVGRITATDDLVGGRGPSYRLTIDLGPRGVRGASIYVGAKYDDRDEVVGRQVVCALDGDEAVFLKRSTRAI
jgi:hypothetical protein